MTTPNPLPTRRIVLTDTTGRILATSIQPDDIVITDPAAPTFGGYLPLEGQVVHTIDLPSHLIDHDGLKQLHLEYLVEVDNGVARLAPIRRQTP